MVIFYTYSECLLLKVLFNLTYIMQFCPKQLLINSGMSIRFTEQHRLQNQHKKQSKLAQVELCAVLARQLSILALTGLKLGWAHANSPAVTAVKVFWKHQCSESCPASELREVNQFIKGRVICKVGEGLPYNTQIETLYLLPFLFGYFQD